MISSVTAQALKVWLHDGMEIALPDVHEHGQYGEAHLFYVVPLPYNRFEIDAPHLVLRCAVRIVIRGDDDGAADRAADRLGTTGYTNVHVPQDGT